MIFYSFTRLVNTSYKSLLCNMSIVSVMRYERNRVNNGCASNTITWKQIRCSAPQYHSTRTTNLLCSSALLENIRRCLYLSVYTTESYESKSNAIRRFLVLYNRRLVFCRREYGSVQIDDATRVAVEMKCYLFLKDRSSFEVINCHSQIIILISYLMVSQLIV